MPTSNILFVNHSEQACGVQQYGKRVANVFKGSSKYNAIYVEPKNIQELVALIQILHPKVTIYNYLPETMPWLNPLYIEQIRRSGLTTQGLIVHNIGYSTGFDFYLHQNPLYPENGHNYALLRPLFKAPNYLFPFRPIPNIGTFGFGFKVKRYDEICRLVNEQFNEAKIRMHLTLSHFRPNVEELEAIKELCKKNITKPGISIEFTDDFRDDNRLIDFLAGNNLNIFLYDNYVNYNGISSVIDYALSIRRPIAVCKSNMFAHINSSNPSICVEDTPLPQIISNGTKPLEHFYSEWSQENFIKKLEGVIERV